MATPPVCSSPASANNLVDLLRRRSRQHPDRIAFIFLSNGEEEGERLTYGELDQRARVLGSHLRRKLPAGERALLLYPPGLELIVGFFGCLYAGMVAVLAHPPRGRRTLPRLAAIVADAAPGAVLSQTVEMRRIAAWAKQVEALARVELIASDALAEELADGWRDPRSEPQTLAFLQYTSGSTAAPKGVMVSHGNLLHNERLIQSAFRQPEGTVVVGWLPPQHDMGLIGNVIQPLYMGGRAILMSPVAFLQSPVRWLRAIDRYRANVSGGPDFAYQLCVDRIERQLCSTIDLSSWEVAFNGAEPVREETLRRFSEHFSDAGFSAARFFPCYGLAEATLLVSGGRQAAEPVRRLVSSKALALDQIRPPEPGDEAGRWLVSSGRCHPEVEVVVVEPQTGRPVEPGEVGEIWVSGPSVAAGYWHNRQATAEIFEVAVAGRPGRFLRSGDLGFVDQGELFVTGRLKDLIIIRGRNHYPQDLELTMEGCHPAAISGRGAAFSVDRGGGERLVLVQEVLRDADLVVEDLLSTVCQAVAELHELQVEDLLLIRRGSLPVTTSGKVRRRRCRELYLQDRLRVVAQWGRQQGAASAVGGVIARPSLDRLRTMDREQRRTTLGPYLLQQLADGLEIDVAQLRPDRPLTAQGLDSLNALELGHRVESEFAVRLSVAELLAGASPRQVLERLVDGIDTRSSASPEHRPENSLGDALSYGEKSLWFLHQLAPLSAAYNLFGALRVQPALDPGRLRRAVAALARRHPALRTTYGTRQGQPYRRVAAAAEMAVNVAVEIEPTAGWSVAKQHSRMVELAHQPIDLESGPLLRVVLFTADTDDSRLLLVLHHIVGDFWSLAILAQELGLLYDDLESVLPTLLTTYAESVQLAAADLDGQRGKVDWKYWRTLLAAAFEDLNLPTDRPRPASQTFVGDRRLIHWPAPLKAAVESLAKDHGVTVYVVLLAVFQVLLHRLSGQSNFAVGSPFAGRERAEQKSVVGYFVNTPVLRAELADSPTFSTFLGRTRDMVLAALEHQSFPFALLAERLRPQRDPSRSPLFQHLFSWHRLPPGAPAGLTACGVGEAGIEVVLGELRATSLSIANLSAQFDLALSITEVDDQLVACLQFNTDLFDSTTAQRWLDNLTTLTTTLTTTDSAAADRPLSRLELLSAGQRQQLMVEWNATERSPAADSVGGVGAGFAAQLARWPQRIAVEDGSGQRSYEAVDRLASGVAEALQGRGHGPRSRIGVFLVRSLDLPAVLLGILRAGAAYLPLDPRFPEPRLEMMIADARPAVVIVEDQPPAFITASGAEPLRLGELRSRLPSRRRTYAEPAAESLAYVLFTSGSSGRPKGVQISHRALNNFLASMAERPGLTAEDRLLAVTTLSFDISVLEIFLPLMVGARLCLASSAAAADGEALGELSRRWRATVLQATPTTWRLLLVAGWSGSNQLTAWCGGEGLPADLATALLQRCARLWNLYGPTETTVWSAIERIEMPIGRIAVGRPIANTRIQLLDQALEARPIGVPGELYIAGDGLSQGYLGRPALTAEKFLPEVSEGRSGARMYATGDLARWLADGRLECLGRTDHQVKVRGFRIELGEIEAAICAHPEIRQAVVVARPQHHGDADLVAYLVAGSEIQWEDLRVELRRSLPDYMVPSRAAFLLSLPLTPNGKVDRRRLPELAANAPRGGGGELRSPLQELLAGLWSELLSVAVVGPRDNFFELGGHSLKAAQLAARVGRAVAVELPVRKIFEAPILADLATAIEQLQGLPPAPTEVLSRVPEDGRRLSFAQQRLWFFDRLQPLSSAYNMAATVGIEGRLEPASLRAALLGVVRRHQILRTAYPERDGEAAVEVLPTVEIELPQLDLSSLAPGLQRRQVAVLAAAEARRPFRLDRAPLLRVCWIRLGAAVHQLLITAHHMVADGWSMDLFFDEFTELYSAAVEDRPPRLSRLRVDYADYAAWQRLALSSAGLAADVAHWRQKLSDPPTLDLPTDRPRRAVQSFRGELLRLSLEPACWEQLQALARRSEATSYMVLLAVFGAFLGRYAGQRDLVIGAPFAERDRLETEPLIGFFVNTLALRFDLRGQPSIAELAQRAKELVLDGYAHRRLPFEQVLEELEIDRTLSHNPLFQVTFSALNPLPQRTLSAVTWSPRVLHNGSAKFDLSLFVVTDPRGPELQLEYASDLFDGVTAKRMLRHFHTLLGAGLSRPDHCFSSLPLLSLGERAQLQVEWNDTAVPRHLGAGREDRSLAGGVVERFREQAMTTPDALAVVGGEGRLSYADLDLASDRWAGHLLGGGVGPESVVGVWADRSLELIIALLAVLKAGGAYLPLDPALPAERVAAQLGDARAGWLLRAGRNRTALPGDWSELWMDQGSQPRGELAGALPPAAVEPQNLAYVIYTSGSTGRPKGVAISHRGLTNLVSWHQRRYRIEPGHRATQMAGLGFDAVVWEIWPYLTAGACLYLAAEDLQADPARLLDWLARKRIDFCFLPTPLAEALLDEPPRTEIGLRVLLTGGDRLHAGKPDGWPFELVNHYGPTESSVVATAGRVAPARQLEVAPDIGRAIDNLQVHVVDQALQLVPIGVVGELVIGGRGLTRGYLGRSRRTAEVLVPEPFGADGRRLYRTGDLVRWLGSGRLEFLRRLDDQVQLRGFRIELGEIESECRRHPAVSEAAVVVLRQGQAESRLVAYLAASELSSETDLTEHLRRRLPGYMVPSNFIFLEQLPVNANGKIDRLRLPPLEGSDLLRGARFVAPRTDFEELLAEIWSDLLQVEKIGVYDSFFELGGHSLMVVRMLSRVRDLLDVELSPRPLFEDPTIAGLSRQIAMALLAENDKDIVEDPLNDSLES